MKLTHLTCSKEQLLQSIRLLSSTPTVERHQSTEKDLVLYASVSENVFDLYQRPAYAKERSFSLGGAFLRGAIVGDGEECEAATQISKFPEHIRADLLCLFLLTVSIVMTVLSGNLFQTMFPLLGLICLCYLIADLVSFLLQARRLEKEWAYIIKTAQLPTGRE